MKSFFFAGIFIGLLIFIQPASAFMADGCGAGECKDCHTMSREEATTLLADKVDKVIDVRFSKVPGLWSVDVSRKGQTVPVYIDFSKKFLIAGTVLQLSNNTDITRERMINLNRIDISTIPLDDALLLGAADAKEKIIVFTDPECSFCRKLHGELEKVVASRPDIAFFIKMFPLSIHPKAFDKAKTIVCEKSLTYLEESLAGKDIPAPTCETNAVSENIALGRRIGVRSTPTLVYPDGRVIPGYKTEDKIIGLLESGEEGGDR